ncbi:MAG: NAD(P)H-dependent flavin oxidoreductase [Hyphomonadaceae bacterium]
MSTGLFDRLRLPLACAPMSFASSVDLAVACSRAGIVAGWQGGTLTPLEDFERYLIALDEVRAAHMDAAHYGPPLVNFPAGIVNDAEIGAPKLKLCERWRPPLVLSSIGDPTEIAKRAHDWGAYVIHDITTVRHAEKALEAGVDGLMLTCAGAGGHTGALTPFAFVPKVRAMFDGLIIAAGGIADVAGINGALALGADIACMGTRFIATPEAGAVDGHKQMIAATGMEEIVISDAMNGVVANWMRPSLVQVGLDPEHMPPKRGPKRGAEMPNGARPWRDIWSAGHSVGLIEDVAPVAEIVERLATAFEAQNAGSWRVNLTRRLARGANAA